MSTDKQSGGPAFPIVEYKQPVGGGSHMMTIIGGMTLRDYFAAKAMQGFCATLTGVTNETLPRWEILAMDAYTLADAMLRAREAKDD
jgi:hypothetical protein